MKRGETQAQRWETLTRIAILSELLNLSAECLQFRSHYSNGFKYYIAVSQVFIERGNKELESLAKRKRNFKTFSIYVIEGDMRSLLNVLGEIQG